MSVVSSCDCGGLLFDLLSIFLEDARKSPFHLYIVVLTVAIFIPFIEVIFIFISAVPAHDKKMKLLKNKQ
jgi:hypothetical protein